MEFYVKYQLNSVIDLVNCNWFNFQVKSIVLPEKGNFKESFITVAHVIMECSLTGSETGCMAHPSHSNNWLDFILANAIYLEFCIMGVMMVIAT